MTRRNAVRRAIWCISLSMGAVHAAVPPLPDPMPFDDSTALYGLPPLPR